MATLFQVVFLGPLISMTGSNKMDILMHKPNTSDLVFMKELFEAGKVVPVIDRCYPLSEVAEALRTLEKDTPEVKLSSLCEGMSQCFQR